MILGQVGVFIVFIQKESKYSTCVFISSSNFLAQVKTPSWCEPHSERLDNGGFISLLNSFQRDGTYPLGKTFPDCHLKDSHLKASEKYL